MYTHFFMHQITMKKYMLGHDSIKYIPIMTESKVYNHSYNTEQLCSKTPTKPI